MTSETTNFDSPEAGRLRYTGASGSLFFLSGVAALSITATGLNAELALGVNGAPVAESAPFGLTAVAGTQVIPARWSATLQQNDYIEVFVRSLDVGSVNLTAFRVTLEANLESVAAATGSVTSAELKEYAVFIPTAANVTHFLSVAAAKMAEISGLSVSLAHLVGAESGRALRGVDVSRRATVV